MSNLNQKLQGLLGSPAFNMGVGLLAAGGNRRGPKVSFGQGLMEASQFANQQSQAYNQLQAQRNQLEAQKRQRDAMGRLGSIMQRGLLSPGQIAQGVQGQMGVGRDDMGLLDPQAAQRIAQGTNFWSGVQNQAQAEIPGLLAQANPGAYTQSASQAMFAAPQQNVPTSAREYMFAAQLPPEQRTEYLQQIGNSPSAVDQARLAQIWAGLDQQNQATRIERAQLQQDYGTRVSGRQSAFNQMKSILSTLKDVRGTVAETGQGARLYGQGAGILAAASRLFPVDSSGFKTVEQQVADLNKGFAALATGAIPQAFMGSDNRLNFYSDRVPSTDQPLGTNLGMLRQMATDIYNDEINSRPVLNELGMEGYKDIERDYQEVMRFIDELESPPGQPGEIPPPPPGARIVN